MKKIVCFTESLAAGGAQRHLVNLAVQFAKHDYDVVFLVYRDNDFFADILENSHIPIKHISNKNWLDRLISATKLLYEEKPDVILSFLETPNFIANFASMFKHKWVLITTELSAKDKTFNGLRARIFLHFQKYANQIVCNSYNAQKKWDMHCPQYKRKLKTIYNPTNELYKDYECYFFGKTNNIKNIVIPASYQYLKNPIRLIQAIQRLPDNYKEHIHIWWYGKKEPQKGNTEAYDQAIEMVNESALSSIITLNEETSDIYNIMAKADCIGLFSTVEGMPNAICEGMMLKKPILMSKVSDFEIFESSGGVLLCDPLDINSIQEALMKLIDLSWCTLIDMGERNYKFASKYLSNDVIINEWLDTINTCLVEKVR